MQTTAPFPAAKPDAFTTMGAPRSRTYASAPSRSVKVRCSAVGTPALRMSSFEKALLDSMRAAALLGPKTGRPLASKRSTTPPARGASGPTTVRSILCAAAQPERASTSVGAISTAWQ